MVSKGDKVQFQFKDGQILGVVFRITSKHIIVQEHKTNKTWKIPVPLSHLLKPAEFETEEVVRFNKGDKVQFEHEGKLIKGIVESVGSVKYKVIEIGKLDSVWNVPIISNLLKKGEFSFELEPLGVMEGYEVRNYQHYPRLSEETPAFNADIYKDGKRVLTAENHGQGAPTSLGGPLEEERAFMAKAEQWERDNGNPKPFESYETWIFWFVEQRPFGGSARECVVPLCGGKIWVMA